MMNEADDMRGQRVDLHTDFLSTCLTPRQIYKYIILTIRSVPLLAPDRKLMGNEIARLKFSQYLFIYEHYKRWYSYIRIGHKMLMEAVAALFWYFDFFWFYDLNE